MLHRIDNRYTMIQAGSTVGKLHDKAIIIIAVEKYNGDYANLPGAIAGARKFRKWAKQPHQGSPYKVLYLTDEGRAKLTADFVRKKVNKFIKETPINRLIVYFAGHGMARGGMNSQFWLLTDAANDRREGINVEAFLYGLQECDFGDADVRGQLCLISDACQSASNSAEPFYGDPILTSTSRQNRRRLDEIDTFYAAQLDYCSFQITDAQNSSFCLFSEIMLRAINGEIQEAIEFQDGNSIVTNQGYFILNSVFSVLRLKPASRCA